MAAITQRLLHLRPVLRPHPYPVHHLSSSSDSGPPSDPPQPEPHSQSQPSFASYFNEVKATLQKEPPSQSRPQPLLKPLTFSKSAASRAQPPPKIAFEEIRRNLSEFRSRTAPPPPSSDSGRYISFQELYKRNAVPKAESAASSSNSSEVKPTMPPSYDTIRKSLRHLRASSPPPKNQSDSRGRTGDLPSIARFQESLKNQNTDLESPRIIGGSDELPSFFNKEKNRNMDENVGSSAGMRTELLKMYSYSQLGEKLKMLRPEKKKGKWFSLNELNERLVRLREIEEKQSQEIGGISIKDFRDIIIKSSLAEEEKTRNKKKLVQSKHGLWRQ